MTAQPPNSTDFQVWLEALDGSDLWLGVALLVAGLLIGWLIGHFTGVRKANRLQATLVLERRMNEERHAVLEKTFASLSMDALQRNNQAFLELAQQVFERIQAQAAGRLDLKEQSIEAMIRPIEQALSKTERQLHQLERERRQAHGSLTQHLESLAKAHQALQGETRNLVQALRRPEVRGRWGELTLHRLVELAGMVEHCDYVEQAHTETSGGTLRPDMIVNMPGGREVVIDVKTPLDAYLNAVEAQNEAERNQFLKQHARNIRERIRELAGKKYWEQFEHAPDFIILFIPGDQFLSAALDTEKSLLEEALQKKVILATPTSLVALLRAVAYGWRQEALTKNAQVIRAIGEDLYNRLLTLSDHMSKLGRSLDASVTQFNRLVGSFQSKVLPGSRKFAELGISDKNPIPEPPQVEKTAREVNSSD
ncbi:MAG: DNA recombination protein RmuC [Gammaproteobacteria bacterium]|nr:DNA recombination protein RmuC [Gammaproteobacteria bacterium]